jgi:hypothetical protein
LARYSTKSVVTRIYKVAASERNLIKSLKRPTETWYECMIRLGRAIEEVKCGRKEPRDENLRLDLPADVYELLQDKSKESGHAMLTILLKAAEHLASA